MKEIYGKELLWYWCNATGDINIPGFPISSLPSADLLPAPARELYEKVWSESSYCNQYVVTFKGQFGLLLGWLFDYSWLRDKGVLTDENKDEIIPKFHKAVYDVAEQLGDQHKHWPVLYGEDTDPDGDEILMFISAEELEEVRTKAWFDSNALSVCTGGLYDDVLFALMGEAKAEAPAEERWRAQQYEPLCKANEELTAENRDLRLQIAELRKKLLPNWLYDEFTKRYAEELAECAERMREYADILAEYREGTVPFNNAKQSYAIRKEQKKQIEAVLAELKKCDPASAKEVIEA